MFGFVDKLRSWFGKPPTDRGIAIPGKTGRNGGGRGGKASAAGQNSYARGGDGGDR